VRDRRPSATRPLFRQRFDAADQLVHPAEALAARSGLAASSAGDAAPRSSAAAVPARFRARALFGGFAGLPFLGFACRALSAPHAPLTCDQL
jgi:hypothetical protein